MGNCATTIYLPSLRTATNRMLFWLSKKYGWQEMEISDHRRSVLKTTLTLDRQSAPAISLRRRVRARLNRDPNTVGMIWTNSSEVTTAVTLTTEYV